MVSFKSLALVAAAVLAAAGPATAQFAQDCGDASIIFTPDSRTAVDRKVAAIGRSTQSQGQAEGRGSCMATQGCREKGFDSATGFQVTVAGESNGNFAATVTAECS